VQYGAGGVDNSNVPRLTVDKNRAFDPFYDCIFIQLDCAAAPPDLSAKPFEDGAALFRDIFPIVTCQQCFAARMFEQTIDGWKLAQKSGGLVSHGENQIYTGKKQIQHDFLGGEAE